MKHSESVKAHNERVVKEYEERKAKKYNEANAIKPVSAYGHKNIREAFAEAFTHYIMELDMNRDQLESFKAVMNIRSKFKYEEILKLATNYEICSYKFL